MPTSRPVAWHQLPPASVLEKLRVDPARGLDPGEVARRRAMYGANAVLQQAPVTLGALLARQITNFVFFLLLAAALLSLALGKALDALAIFVVLALNTGAGLFMDYRAEREIAALRSLAAPTARVRREGSVLEIAATELVPGDLILLEAGVRMPADGRLLEGTCHADESLLTGESIPVLKRPFPIAADPLPLAEHTNEIFAGTHIVTGSGLAVATETGANTQVGRLGTLLVSTVSPKTPLSDRLDELGRSIAILAGVASVLVIAIGWWQGRPFEPTVAVAVALAIAVIPEGLPSVATLALAAGAKRLTKHGLLLRRLGALESLGSVSAFCLDKTGTLTTNQMTVRTLNVGERALTVTGTGWEPVGAFSEGDRPLEPLALPRLVALLRAVQYCNDATLEFHGDFGWHVHGDPSEGALLVVAAKAGLDDPRARGQRMAVLPAGIERPWMLVVVREAIGDVAYVKGAPEQVAARCTWTCSPGDAPMPLDRAAWLRASREGADRALRVFGVARKRLAPGWQPASLESDWEWLGLVGMADPPRPGVAAALADARRAGIRIMMLTGDHPTTALAIARELSLTGDRPPVAVLATEQAALGADIYARITPEGKYGLVRSLQAGGDVVVMTGDGVNDAPALRAADVGIAMGQGADVAKQAAAAVLLDQRLSSVLEGIREGRAAFLNIQKAVDYLLTCSLTAMFVVLLATIANFPQPLAPLQLLYLNLLMHSLPALGLATEPAEPGVMTRAPFPREAPLLPPVRLGSILWQALLLAVVAISVGSWALAHGGEAHGRTLVFAALATSLLCHALSDRSPDVFGGWRGHNAPLFLFLGAALAMQLAAIYLPGPRLLLDLTTIESNDWLAIVAAAFSSVVAIELSKPAFFAANGKRP